MYYNKSIGIHSKNKNNYIISLSTQQVPSIYLLQNGGIYAHWSFGAVG